MNRQMLQGTMVHCALVSHQ